MPDVFLPDSLDALWRVWADRPEARIFAGGTDIFVAMRAGRVQPTALIGLERIGELQAIGRTDGTVTIGAAATFQQLLDSPLIAPSFPLLVQAIKMLGSPPIRHMGTIGGNIVTASPAGDTLPPLVLLEAEVEIRAAAASRRVPIADFIRAPGKTDLRAGEIVAAVRLPAQPDWSISHFEKVGRRQSLAIAVVSLAALVLLDGDQRITQARLAWGSVGPTVVTCPAADAFLQGRPLNHETLAEAGKLAANAVAPIDDIRASAAYRRAVAANLLLRLARK